MRLVTLLPEQFRNLAPERLAFVGADTHIFIGANGTGKTNILEAMSFLSLTRSFLGVTEEDTVAWGADFIRVSATVEDDSGEALKLELVSTARPRKQKAAFLNDVRTPVARLVGKLPSVAFLPQDLELFVGAPSLRRRFMDDILCQTSTAYDQALSTYGKILRQRSSLLKKIADGVCREVDLEQWDAMLVEQGSLLTAMRLELLGVLQCSIGDEVHALGERWDSVRIDYLRKGTACDQAAIAEEFRALLFHYRERDLLLLSTTVGPHREDWTVTVEERPLTTFASRGQQRAAVLAMLFLTVSYLELKRGEKPIILLDDVFSELDDLHQSQLLAALAGHQVFCTATHLPPGSEHAIVWDVENGRVRRKARSGKRSGVAQAIPA
ncbi:MAG: DNA replication and repair protein RecF [Candidatus Peribacteraceae bacterium]|nr:DNA replication and repair protein RecF [Candidatus Peribacteraceae bacterium]